VFIKSVKDNNHFLRAYRKGRYVTGGFITLHFVKNGLSERRLGLTVSKKLGNAVFRNRTKRIIRAAVFDVVNDLPQGFDYVFIAREGIADKLSSDVHGFLTERAIPFIHRGLQADTRTDKVSR
jgi:ribonuclease P protein component